MNATGRYVASVPCGDGRIQEAVATWARNELGVDYVDRATMAGPDQLWNPDVDLSAFYGDPQFGVTLANRKQVIKADLSIYIKAHNAEGLLFYIHTSCAGNPVGKAKKIATLDTMLADVATWPGIGHVPTYALLVQQDEQGSWYAELIATRNVEQMAAAA